MHLALAVHPVLPSAYTYGVGIPKYLSLSRQGMHFAAQYPVCTYPCQRFAFVLTEPKHDSGPLWIASPSTYETFIHNTLPV